MAQIWAISNDKGENSTAPDSPQQVDTTGPFMVSSTLSAQLTANQQSLLFPDISASNLLSNLTNELRHPTSMVIQYACLLQRQDCGQLSEKQVAAIAAILGNSQQLLTRIDSLLEWLRAEANCLKLVPTRINLEYFLPELVTLLRQRYPAVDMSFEISLNDSFIVCDRNRLHSILNSLMTDALNLTETRKVQIWGSDSQDTWSLKMIFSCTKTHEVRSIGAESLLTNALVQALHGDIKVEVQSPHTVCIEITFPRDYRLT